MRGKPIWGPKHTHTNGGYAGVCTYNWQVITLTPVKKERKKYANKLHSRSVSEKWLDWELVRKKVVVRGDGKLGVRDESGKVRLWRAFTGKSFDEMEDLVPLRELVDWDGYGFASVYWLVYKRFTGYAPGKWRLSGEDLGILFMMHRFETALGGNMFVRAMLEYGFASDPLRHQDKGKGRRWLLTHAWTRKMMGQNLIEQVPGLKVFEGRKIAIFRLAPGGRRLLKSFLEAFRSVHEDIRFWAKNNEDREYLRRYVARYCLGVDEQACASLDNATFEEMLELSKKDLISMGLTKKAGKKPAWYDDLPDGEG